MAPQLSFVNKTAKLSIMKKKFLCLLLVLSATFFVYAQDTTLRQYVGKYKIPDAGMEITVKLDTGGLIITFPAGDSPLTNIGIDSFDAIHLRKANTIVFKRNDAKKVNGINFITDDITLEGKKEE